MRLTCFSRRVILIGMMTTYYHFTTTGMRTMTSHQAMAGEPRMS